MHDRRLDYLPGKQTVLQPKTSKFSERLKWIFFFGGGEAH